MNEITSLTNQQIKDAVKLQQRKYRTQSGLFLLEGFKPIFEAKNSDIKIETVFTTKKHLEKFKFVQDKITLVTDPILEKLSTTESMPEAVAIAQQCQYSTDFDCKRIVLLENIKDAGNLGTIIRSAVAFGLDAIVLCGDSIDIFNPKVVRSAVGALFKIPVIKIDDITEFKKQLEKHNFIATVLNHKDIINPSTIDFSAPFVLMMGSEADGLSEEAISLSDTKTTIPISADTESLNLSAAASILFYISSL